MGYSITGNRIKLTRGDSLDIQISVATDTGQAYTPAQEDTIRFAMKSSRTWPGGTGLEGLLLYKAIPNDTLLLHIDPADTSGLPLGEYDFDVEIEFETGHVDTFITGILELTAEVF